MRGSGWQPSSAETMRLSIGKALPKHAASVYHQPALAYLADRLQVSRQSVNAIETGRYDPSLPLAFRIAELFELKIEDVFTSPSQE